MNEITLKIIFDTSYLDEAIVKAKMLNEELEKAKSKRVDLAASKICIFVESNEIDTTKLIEKIMNIKLHGQY